MDQQRYSKSIVQRYLPNADVTPSEKDLWRYRSPLPHGFKWTKEDNSKSMAEVKALEDEYSFRVIEVVGSLNYLANTAVEELFAIRKACKHMNLPGRPHFKAILHLLHHLRCYPAQGLIFYRDWKQSPVYKMLTEELGIPISDGTLIWMSDSSHADCDEGRSTGGYFGIFQGGVVTMNSFVPQPIPHSTAESETMGIGMGALSCSYTRKAIADLLFDDPDRPWTIPFLSDSQAAIAMNKSERPTKRNKHIDRQYFYGRNEKLAGNLEFLYIDTDHCLPDVVTKALVYEQASSKLKYLQYPVSDHAIGPKAIEGSPRQALDRLCQSKKGDVDDDSSVTETGNTGPNGRD